MLVKKLIGLFSSLDSLALTLTYLVFSCLVFTDWVFNLNQLLNLSLFSHFFPNFKYNWFLLVSKSSRSSVLIALLYDIQGVPKKRGISECYSFTTHLILNLENLSIIHLKVDICMFVLSTIPFLRDISELRNISFIIWFVCL